MKSQVLLAATMGALWVGLPACAQHLDVLVQVVDGKIVTGAADYDSNTWLVGQQVYKRQLLSNFRTPDPGFTGLETGNPLLEPGVLGLAPQIDLRLDIVPTTIDGQRANFWWWDGVDTGEAGYELADVAFGAAPAGVTWNLFDADFELLTADGSDAVVPGALIQRTFSDGAVHQHLVMQVADGDGNSQTTPPQGIYMTAMVLQAEGFEESEPFFFVHRTAGLNNEPRDVAADWARINYSTLVDDLPRCDFDGDGLCDGVDIDQLMNDAETGGLSADLNGDGVVNETDRDEWLATAGLENGFVAPFLVGDADLNGRVESVDLNALAINWQDDTRFNWTDGNYTIAGDPGVFASDLNQLAINWQGEVAMATAGRAVPEPTALELVLATLMGLFAMRR